MANATKKWIQAASIKIDDETGELLVRVGGGVAVKQVKIDAASAGAAGNELVAAVAGKKICVLAMCVMAAEAVNATFYSGPADSGTAMSGPMPLGDNGGFVNSAPPDPSMHWIETAAGERLSMLLSNAKQVSGWIVYYEG